MIRNLHREISRLDWTDSTLDTVDSMHPKRRMIFARTQTPHLVENQAYALESSGDPVYDKRRAFS